MTIEGIPIREAQALITFIGATNWSVGFLTTVAIFGILALALNLQWGYTGTFNFGIVAFFMVGAYTSAILTVDAPSQFEDYIGGYSLPIPIGWLGGAIAGGVLALIIGLPTLRLRRDFLAIATIGFAAILRSVAASTENFVNQARGMNGIPRFLDHLVEGGDREWLIGRDYQWVLLGIAVTMLLFSYIVVRAATASPWGRVLRALRDNEETARSVGKDTTRYRMQAFVLGGMIMGLAGAIWAHRVSAIGPDSFSDLFGTFLVWTMVIIGGSGNNRGAVLGALVVGLIWFGVPLIQEDLPDFLGSRVFMVRQFMIGLLIVVFLLLRPQGLIPEDPIVSRWVPHPSREGLWSRVRARLRPSRA